MAMQIADRVKETTTTTGTGALSLAGAMTGFRAFSSVMNNNDTCWYALQAVDSNGVPTGNWEVGLGTYTASGNTLARTTVFASSNSNALVNLASGTTQVWIGQPAAKQPGFDAARVYLGGTLNTTGPNAWIKVALDTVDSDPSGLWDATNKRFQPKRAGYYQCNLRNRCGAAALGGSALGKNGALLRLVGTDSGSATYGSGGGGIVYCNGTTDTVEPWVYSLSSGIAFTNGTFDTYMEIFGPLGA